MNKKTLVFILISASLIANVVYAKVIFSCETTNNKNVLVKDFGDFIEYKFGKNLENPELELKVPRDKASTRQWNGMTRNQVYRVNIPNKNISYSVFRYFDSMAHSSGSGIYVIIDDKIAATVDCIDDTTVAEIEGIDLKDSDW
ncbi:hypothetical protein AB4341_07850 [Vibrio breoganii]